MIIMSRYLGRPPRWVREQGNAIIYFKEIRDMLTLSKYFRDQCDIDGKQEEKCEILRDQGNTYPPRNAPRRSSHSLEILAHVTVYSSVLSDF